MKQKIYILFTSGRGPLECSIAVHGIQKKFRKFLDRNNLEHKIISQKDGQIVSSMETIVIEINTDKINFFKDWMGTIQWTCKSPVRKFNKRRNWFIKSEQVVPNESISINNKDVTLQTYRASGPGGQHRNKVETAVRLIHNKSGLIVTASDGKSQMQNKKKAWKKLELKLNEWNKKLLESSATDQWSSQIEIQRGDPVKIFAGEKFIEK